MDKHLYNTNTNVLTEAEQLWEKCLTIIKDNVAYSTYQTWFIPIKAVGLNDNVITLQVPSQFFYEWLEEHYVELLGKTIKRVLGRVGRLEYRIMMESSSNKHNPATMNISGSAYPKQPKESNFIDISLKRSDPHDIKTPYAIPGLKRVQIDPQLNSNYVFDNYVEGDCNRVARSAGIHVGEGGAGEGERRKRGAEQKSEFHFRHSRWPGRPHGRRF